MPRHRRPRGPASRPPALLLAAALTVLFCGCATTLKTPNWPWSKRGDEAGRKVAGELGEDADSEIISSEYTPPTDPGWDWFKGENVKRRWKRLVGRGPNEPVARRALAEADGLYNQRKFKEAISKYKVAIDRWPDSAIEEEAMWQLAECWFFTDQYPKAEDA